MCFILNVTYDFLQIGRMNGRLYLCWVVDDSPSTGVTGESSFPVVRGVEADPPPIIATGEFSLPDVIRLSHYRVTLGAPDLKVGYLHLVLSLMEVVAMVFSVAASVVT